MEREREAALASGSVDVQHLAPAHRKLSGSGASITPRPNPSPPRTGQFAPAGGPAPRLGRCIASIETWRRRRRVGAGVASPRLERGLPDTRTRGAQRSARHRDHRSGNRHVDGVASPRRASARRSCPASGRDPSTKLSPIGSTPFWRTNSATPGRERARRARALLEQSERRLELCHARTPGEASCCLLFPPLAPLAARPGKPACSAAHRLHGSSARCAPRRRRLAPIAQHTRGPLATAQVGPAATRFVPSGGEHAGVCGI